MNCVLENLDNLCQSNDVMGQCIVTQPSQLMKVTS
jgi:hypothetical protein